MSSLDFSELSDDQLVGLVRAALEEAVRRNPACTDAMRGAVLDEAEKAKIAIAATEREVARLRALERERIAKQAAEAARRQAEAQTALDREARIAQKAAEALALAEKREADLRTVLVRAAALVGREPSRISVLVLPNDARYGGGTRVLINPGSCRYERDHLVDYCCPTSVRTRRELVGRKKELVPFCAELAARWDKIHIAGAEFAWEDTDHAE